MNRFKVNIGCTASGRERNRYFPTLEAAQQLCSKVFAKTKIVLSIVEVKPRKKGQP
jgi:hypothetical protein